MPTSKWRRVGWQRRQKFPDADPPTFFAHNLASGLQAVEIIFLDWGCGEATDATSQLQYLSLELLRVAEHSTAKLNSENVSHVKIGELYYQFMGARKSLGERNDWVVRCSISGDKFLVPSP